MVMGSSREWTEDASERRCDMKGRPCGMMRIAKFKWPSRDRSSRLEQLVFSRRVDETRIMRSIFSLGREAWNLIESKLIPRNSMDVAGPVVFSCAIGIPSAEKTFWTVMICVAGMASGDEIIKKSSSRWIRWGMA